jgi:3D (Asp-Asp-Asp) domain-containing protein
MPVSIIRNAVLTAYCSCRLCTPGHNVTANGLHPQEGVTIAIPRRFPLGSRVEIIVDGEVYTFRGDDRTSRKYDGVFDIYLRGHRRAKEFGSKIGTVYVYSE